MTPPSPRSPLESGRAQPSALPRRVAALAAAIAALVIGVASAAASPPDRAFSTPVAKGAQARTAVSAAQLQSGLNRHLRRSGGRGGAYVADPTTGAVLYSRGASRALQIASNMKLFTTATALQRLGPEHRFGTRLVAPGGVVNGVVQGNLILRGGGDPGLTRKGLAALAGEARAAGLAVSGRLLYDESFFDRRRTVQQKGVAGGPFAELGRLSGLSFEGGRARDPARTAALKMVALLRKRGVDLPKKTRRGTVPGFLPPEAVLAEVDSQPLAALARSTNTFSINFYAEMLLKGLAAEVQGRGTTAAGASLVRSFAATAGGALRAVNGSGLSRSDRASPRSIAALLAQMLSEEDPVRDAFLGSLAVAGRTGTLARRMRGTAADGRCIGKTGTLAGVSALSGYCEVAPERFVVFSILMNKVAIRRAHIAQDRMTALIAGYTP